MKFNLLTLILVFSKKLYANDRSTVTLGILFLIIPIYLAIAAVWNTGYLIDQKMQAQAVADAAALTAAQQMSSAANEMVMLNMLRLRIKAAEIMGGVCVATATAGTVGCGVIIAYDIAQIAVSLGINLPASFDLALATVDLGFGIKWLTTVGKGLSAARKVVADPGKKIIKLQDDAEKNLAKYIFKQLQETEKTANSDANKIGESEFNIYAVTKNARLYSPEMETAATAKLAMFEKTPVGKRMLLLLVRLLCADAQWAGLKAEVKNIATPPDPKNSWKFPAIVGVFKPQFFDVFKSGRLSPVDLKTVYKIAWYASLAAAIGISGGVQENGYLVKDYGVDADKSPLQVVVLVEKTQSDTAFMAKGFFKPPLKNNAVLAMAQAETYNNYRNVVGQLKVLGDVLDWINKHLVPFYDYASIGANYQARLTPVNDKLVSGIIADTKVGTDLKKILAENMNGVSDVKGVIKTDVFLH